MRRPYVILSHCVRSISQNKGRSFLSALGIAIGVGSLSLLLAISSATESTVASKLSELGANQYILRSKGNHDPARPAVELMSGDAEVLSSDLFFTRTAPATQCFCLVASASEWAQQPVLGTSASMFKLRGWRIDQGRQFLPSEVEEARAVAVIGPGIAMRLFPLGGAVGAGLRINGIPFKVVGITAGTGLNLDGVEPSNQVIVPITAVPRPWGMQRDQLTYLSLQASRDVSSEKVLQRVAEKLSEARGLQLLKEDFTLVDLAAIGAAAKDVSRALSAAFLFVALIALLVGGVGIMNVMLASAAERTRDCGIQLALGAAPLDIFVEFLVESVMLCVLAAFSGVALAILLASAITTAGTLQVVVSLRDAMISFGVAVGIGTCFGVWPAKRAAAVSPNEALRAG